jgi:hypothetical protein
MCVCVREREILSFWVHLVPNKEEALTPNRVRERERESLWVFGLLGFHQRRRSHPSSKEEVAQQGHGGTVNRNQ